MKHFDFDIKHRIDEVYLRFLLSYTRFFNYIMAFQMVILTLYVTVFIFLRSLLGSQAYAWALTRPLMGFNSYTIIAILAFLCIGMWFVSSSKNFLIAGLVMFTWIQLMFGISILVLTLTGQTAAITGTIQWISLPIVNIILLITSGIPPSSQTK